MTLARATRAAALRLAVDVVLQALAADPAAPTRLIVKRAGRAYGAASMDVELGGPGGTLTTLYLAGGAELGPAALACAIDWIRGGSAPVAETKEDG